MEGRGGIRVISSASQTRKRVEEIFGWMKTVGGIRKQRHRGLQLVGWMFALAAAAYNLVRIRNLATAIPPWSGLRSSVSQRSQEANEGLITLEKSCRGR